MPLSRVGETRSPPCRETKQILAAESKTRSWPVSDVRCTAGSGKGGEIGALNPAHGHIHKYQEERFEIIEGRARFLIGKEQIDLSPGDVGVVPPNTVHHWEALDGKPVRAKASFTPGLRTGAWFVHFQKHLAEGKMDLFQAAVISSEYGKGSPMPAEPPALVWNVLVSVLAPIGRALGYKAC